MPGSFKVTKLLLATLKAFTLAFYQHQEAALLLISSPQRNFHQPAVLKPWNRVKT